MIKKNELLPYCPAELVAKHANEYYQVDRYQDVFQFGIVVFFCLFGRLPWQVKHYNDKSIRTFCITLFFTRVVRPLTYYGSIKNQLFVSESGYCW